MCGKSNTGFSITVEQVDWHILYISDMWETAFLRKNTCQHDLFVSNPNVSFAQDLITISIIVISLLTSDVL